MARSFVRAALLAAAVLAVVGARFVSASASASEPDAGLDASFLTSWLGLDASEAAHLASNGVAAAAKRREMLATAAAGNGFGEQALPGAYPPPPITFTVEFTAFLANRREATFTAAARAAYLRLVLAQARLTGTAQPPVVTTVFANNRPNPATGLFVRVRVTFVERMGAQKFQYALNQDTKPAWLTGPYTNAAYILPTVTNTVPCSAALCLVCWNTPSKCSQCVPSVGAPSSPAFRTVYQNNAGVCRTCTSPNCATCTAGGNGRCATCKAGFFINATGQCVKCTLPNCQRCATFNTCAACRPGLFVNPKGQCAGCTLPNCQRCATLSTCAVCRTGSVLTSGKCVKCPINCNNCINADRCRANGCKPGFFVTPVGRCQKCTLRNCVRCNSNGTCATCLPNFRVSNGVCVRRPFNG